LETKQMPNELTSEHVKALFDYASNINRGPYTVYATRLLERVSEIGDPLYTPLALSLLETNYRKLGHRELELQTLKRVTLLPKDQQILLNPAWVSACYQKTGDFKTAGDFLKEILDLSPHEPSAIAGLAEISLFTNSTGDAQARSAELQKRPEPHYQILGHLFSAFALYSTGHAKESAQELDWVAEFLISTGTVPAGTWDYRDLQQLLPKMGTNTKAAIDLIEVLSGRIPLPEFAQAWTDRQTPSSAETLPTPSN
jgi:tetratricopeptide (TPR) repeat protein